MEKAKNIEEVAAIMVDAAIKVHKALGPGLGFPLNWNVVLMKKGIPEGVLRTNVW